MFAMYSDRYSDGCVAWSFSNCLRLTALQMQIPINPKKRTAPTIGPVLKVIRYTTA